MRTHKIDWYQQKYDEIKNKRFDLYCSEWVALCKMVLEDTPDRIPDTIYEAFKVGYVKGHSARVAEQKKAKKKKY